MTCYHVRITKKSDRSWDIVWLDLHWEELEERIIAPYRTGQPITINGQSISINDIEQLRITETEMDSTQLRPEVERERQSRRVSTGISIEWYIADKGTDVTNVLITAPPGSEPRTENKREVQLRPAPGTRNVFVSHGRNDAARNALFEFLRAVDLHPLEWNEAVRATGKPLPYIGDILDAAFSQAHAVVVLLTPDDEARLREPFRRSIDDPTEFVLTGQARQNVLFEAGAAMARHPNRTVIVELGHLRPFSNISGLHTIRLNDSPERRQEFAQRLETAGCPVKLDGGDWYRAGEFEAAVVLPEPTESETNTPLASSPSVSFSLTSDAKSLLTEAAKDKSGILRVQTAGGLIIQTNRTSFAEVGDRRSEARWDQALRDLLGLDLIESGGGDLFEVTHYGFQVADELDLGIL